MAIPPVSTVHSASAVSVSGNIGSQVNIHLQPSQLEKQTVRATDAGMQGENEPKSESARHYLPIHDCGDWLDASDVVLCATQIVAVDYDQVGELAGFD
jgi:hypothetical protein